MVQPEIDHILNQQDQRDTKEKIRAKMGKKIRRLFSPHEEHEDHITGRPHHVPLWITGILTGLGAHRRGPTSKR